MKTMRIDDWRAYVRRQLPALDIRPEREAEIVDELALQLESAYDTALASGVSEAEARRRAETEVPDWAALAATLARIERPVAARLPGSMRPASSQIAIGTLRGGMMTGLIQDLRYGLRTFARGRGFAAVAVLTMALGIGATTAVYSVVDGVLLQPLPMRDPDRIVLARELSPEGNQFSVSWPNFQDWQARAKSFEALAAWRGIRSNLTGIDRPQRLMTRQVTWNTLDVIGVQPMLGRSFTEADDRPGAALVTILNYPFWQRQFGGDASILGKRLMLNDAPATVIGVLPPGFAINGVDDIFIPLGPFLTAGSYMLDRGNHWGLNAIGRLKPGISVESARAELEGIATQLSQEYPATNSGNRAATFALYELIVQSVRPMIITLLVAVGALLLIGCANLANLLLARASGRGQEIAIRQALGASRWRVMRQLMTESVLLSTIGGAAGIVLAYAALDAMLTLLPQTFPRLHLIQLNPRVLAVAALLSIATGVLFGLAPALQSASGRAVQLLRMGRVTRGESGRWTRRGLLIVEVALSLVLLTGAGLMARTMGHLLAIDPGFQSDHVISAQFELTGQRYTPERRRAFHTAALEKLHAMPGVTGAAFTLSLPIDGSNWGSVYVIRDRPVPDRANLPTAAFTPVSAGYFDVMNIRLLQGRQFTEADTHLSHHVAVVNETFVRKYFPDGGAVGGYIKQGWPEWTTPWREIVGVVNDIKISGVDQPVSSQIYLPLLQEPSSALAAVVRSTTSPDNLRTAVETALHEVDSNVPVFNVRTLDEVLSQSMAPRQLTMTLLVGFSVIALVLAAVGVFGVAAYTVAQRTQELGVRMALGADRRTILRLILREELSVCAVGVVLGSAVAIGTAHLITEMVYGIPPRDPQTLTTAAIVLLAVTGIACYLPARRATRVDPVIALRAE